MITLPRLTPGVFRHVLLNFTVMNFDDLFLIPDGMDQASDIKTWLDVRLTALQDPEDDDFMSTHDEEDTRPILF